MEDKFNKKYKRDLKTFSCCTVKSYLNRVKSYFLMGE